MRFVGTRRSGGVWAFASRARGRVALAALLAFAPLGSARAEEEPGLPDAAKPLDLQGFDRPRPLLELGAPFLKQGKLGTGFRLPTGAVWQPTLMLFGSGRSALQSIDASGLRVDQWANRVDLTANLAFTPTERIVASFRPLDRRGLFTGFERASPDTMRWRDGMNGNLKTLFFEGDFGEIFPKLDHRDRRPLDVGFAVGRQPLQFSDGLLIQDTLDAVGITRNTLRPHGLANLRLTGLFAWNGVDHDDGTSDPRAALFGLLTNADLRALTLDVDAVLVASATPGADGFFAGAAAIGRVGLMGVTLRGVASVPLDSASGAGGGDTSLVGRGTLLEMLASWSPRSSHDLLYASAFAALGHYTSASRDRGADGVLGNVGILYSGVGMGRYGAVLSSDTRRAFGGAFGYQLFFDRNRRQLVFEVGARTSTDGVSPRAAALGVRFEQAFAQRYLLRLDGFLAARQSSPASLGARSEFQVKF